ncbi:MAG: peptidoglycan DD-metalloendopeptidase family protein [Acidimicrobiia bacterium]|nr:peptidoglycan DD-metalloendopeptidase family protein [Acidimicrobiia bacterium]
MAPVDPAELAALKEQYDEAVADEADALAEYELAVGELDATEAQVEELTALLDDTEDDLEQAKADAIAASADHEAAEEALDEVQRRLADEQDSLRRQAVEAYVAGGTASRLTDEILAEPSITKAGIIFEYGEVFVESQRALVDLVVELEIDAASLAADLAEAEAAARDAAALVAAREQALRQAQVVLLQTRYVLGIQVSAQRTRLAEIQSRKADFELRMNALQSDSDGIGGRLADWQRTQVRAELLPTFSRPTDPTPISSGFGPRLHPIFNTVRRHTGLDIGAPMGAEIRAGAAGTVVIAEARSGYGLVTVIDHGDQVATLYAHQSAFNVVVGQQVARGDLIGFIGSTGFSTGPHLHWEVRILGDPIDPISLIDLDQPWPVPCEVLAASGHPADLTAWSLRPECTDPPDEPLAFPETTTTTSTAPG